MRIILKRIRRSYIYNVNAYTSSLRIRWTPRRSCSRNIFNFSAYWIKKIAFFHFLFWVSFYIFILDMNKSWEFYSISFLSSAPFQVKHLALDDIYVCRYFVNKSFHFQVSTRFYLLVKKKCNSFECILCFMHHYFVYSQNIYFILNLYTCKGLVLYIA